jgi:hypothetical protein
MRERRPVFVGSGEVPIWHQFYWTNSTGSILLDQFYWTNSTGPILLDQFGTSSTDSVSSTDSTRLRLLFEFLNPSLRSLHLFDGSVQFPFGTNPPLADPPKNREQADNG